MADVPLQCECGKVKGVAREVSPGNGTRILCYCDDCQAFARYLGNEQTILDQYGGIDIYQMAQGRIAIEEGSDQLRCVRLSEKGMHRWYCNCCRTPIGNTLGGTMPFIGVITCFIHDKEAAESAMGPVRGKIFTAFASPNAPSSLRESGNPWLLLIRAMRKIMGWKLRGLGQPSPFFDKDGKPVAEPQILS